MKLAVVIPSRGRPDQCAMLVGRVAMTAPTRPLCLVVVDEDDPTLWTYRDRLSGGPASVVAVPGAGHVAAINAGAAEALTSPEVSAIAKLDDDHWPVTHGWDEVMLTALDEMGGGIVYGDDLLQGERLPTAPAISTDVIKALGWMGPPVLQHMFVDDFWRDLGKGADCQRYLPDVVIEHRHPAVGKAEIDEGYRRVGTEELFERDQAAYQAFTADPSGLPAAIERVRAQHVGKLVESRSREEST